MKIRLTPLLITALLSTAAQAQQISVQYYDRFSVPTKNKQDIATYKVFTESDTDPNIISVKETNVITKQYNIGSATKTDSLPNGLFRYYDANKQLIREVNYVNGQREGICNEYTDGVLTATYRYKDNYIQEPVEEFYPSGKLKSKKQYLEGTDKIINVIKGDTALTNYLLYNTGGDDMPVKTRLNKVEGIWNGVCTYYYESGQIASEEHFRSGKLIRASFWDAAGKRRTSVKDVWQLNIPPSYKGNYVNFLMNAVIYPKEAIRQQVAGTVVVGFDVYATGKVGAMTIIRSVSPELDKEALRVLQKTTQKWNPARYHNIPVNQYYAVPIIFNL